MTSRLSLAVCTLSMIFTTSALTGCEDDGLNALEAELAVEGCAEITAGTAVEQDCSLQTGNVPRFGSKLLEIVVENTGAAPLTFEGVALDSTSDPSFAVAEVPSQIAPGEVGLVHVRFSPQVEGTVRAGLTLRSNAANIPCIDLTGCDVRDEGVLYRNFTIEIEGQGVDGAPPVIDVDKIECVFGAVGIGAEGACSLSIGNLGEGELFLLDVSLNPDVVSVPPGSAGLSVFSVNAPGQMALVPGMRTSVNITFSPDRLGLFGAVLTIASNDPERPQVDVLLAGEQVDAPTCQIRVASVNNQPVNANPTVEPLDDVVVTAAQSTPASSGANIVGVSWSWVERPTGSTLSFSQPFGVSTGFAFADGVAGVDLAGHYRIAATVTDTNGQQSTNLCEVTFDAVPSQALLVQLGWDSPTDDMDLHLVKMDGGGQFCSAFAQGGEASQCFGGDTDCHFANCTFGGLDWDDNGQTDSLGDPSLDIDDLCGFGPENITTPTPEPGQYLVSSHYWGPSCGGFGEPVGNTVRVFINGVLAYEAFREMAIDEWWEVAVIHWPGPNGVPCIEPMDSPGSCG